MSYQINYDPTRANRFYTAKRKKIPVWLMTALCIGIATLLLNNEFRSLLIPGDPQVTSDAFSELTQELAEGESVKEAVTAFCKQIIDNASPTD